jgi:hypothetical protein
MSITARLLVSQRISLWGSTLSPENPVLIRDLTALGGTVRERSNLFEVSHVDYLDTALALDHKYISITIGSTVVYNSDDLRRLLNSQFNPTPPLPPSGNSELLIDDLVYACPPAMPMYAFAYLVDADTVDESDASDPSTFPAIGVVIEKPTPTTCKLAYAGKVSGFSALLPGFYFISNVPGAIQTSPPTQPGWAVQPIGWARNDNALILQIDRSFTVL